MPLTNPTQLTPLPNYPTKGDPVNAFNSGVELWNSAIKGVFTPQFNDQIKINYENALVSYQSAIQAQQSATAAQSAAVATNAILWFSGGAVALNDVRISPSSWMAYRRIVSGGANTIDPANDTTNWKRVSFSGKNGYTTYQQGFYQIPPDAGSVNCSYGGYQSHGVKLPDSRLFDIGSSIAIRNNNPELNAQVFNYFGGHVCYIPCRSTATLTLNKSFGDGSGDWIYSDEAKMIGFVNMINCTVSGQVASTVIDTINVGESSFVFMGYPTAGVSAVLWNTENDTSSIITIPGTANYSRFCASKLFDNRGFVFAYTVGGINYVALYSIATGFLPPNVYSSSAPPIELKTISNAKYAIIGVMAGSAIYVTPLSISSNILSTGATVSVITTAYSELFASYVIPSTVSNDSIWIKTSQNVVMVSISPSNAITVSNVTNGGRYFSDYMMPSGELICPDTNNNTVCCIKVVNGTTISQLTIAQNLPTNSKYLIVSKYQDRCLIACSQYLIYVAISNGQPSILSSIYFNPSKYDPSYFDVLFTMNFYVVFIFYDNQNKKYVFFDTNSNLVFNYYYHVESIYKIKDIGGNSLSFLTSNETNFSYSTQSESVFEFSNMSGVFNSNTKIRYKRTDDIIHRIGLSSIASKNNMYFEPNKDVFVLEKASGFGFFMECI